MEADLRALRCFGDSSGAASECVLFCVTGYGRRGSGSAVLLCFFRSTLGQLLVSGAPRWVWKASYWACRFRRPEGTALKPHEAASTAAIVGHPHKAFMVKLRWRRRRRRHQMPGAPAVSAAGGSSVTSLPPRGRAACFVLLGVCANTGGREGRVGGVLSRCYIQTTSLTARAGTLMLNNLASGSPVTNGSGTSAVQSFSILVSTLAITG